MLHWFLCWATEALPSQDLLRSRRQTPQSLFFCERKDQIPSAVSQNMPAREGISAHIHSMMLHPRSKPKMTDVSCCQVTPLKTHCCSSAQEKKKKVSQMTMKQGTRDVLCSFQLDGTPLGALPEFSFHTWLHYLLQSSHPFLSVERTYHFIYWAGLLGWKILI